MHPTGGGSYLPMLNSLAKQNIDTVWCDSRYRGTDSALIMEKVLIDLGNCIKSLKTHYSYEKIVLGGWSGGGSLSLFYQSEAENPSITETPSGDLINLVDEKFIPADGIAQECITSLDEANICKRISVGIAIALVACNLIILTIPFFVGLYCDLNKSLLLPKALL